MSAIKSTYTTNTRTITGEDRKRRELRHFGFIFGAMLAAIFGLVIPLIWGLALPSWPWMAAAVFWITALIVPQALDPAFRAWIKIGLVLGWINTRIVLGAVFFLIFTPVALVMRLVGRDAIQRRLDPEAPTYRIPSRQPDHNHLEKPY